MVECITFEKGERQKCVTGMVIIASAKRTNIAMHLKKVIESQRRGYREIQVMVYSEGRERNPRFRCEKSYLFYSHNVPNNQNN